MKKAFTLIELIFAIVLIGVLASVAIPKFSGLSNNSKIASELSTAASVQAALDACHGEWIINESIFECGNILSNSLDFDVVAGYPNDLGDSLDKILKNGAIGWSRNGTQYRGPASSDINNVSCKDNTPHEKPCKETYWLYNKADGSFTLISE